MRLLTSRPALGAALLAALIASAAGACTRRGDAGRDSGEQASDDPCAIDPTPVVTAGGVGPVKLGQPLPEEAERCAHDTTWTTEGLTEAGRVVKLGEGEVIALAPPPAGGSGAGAGTAGGAPANDAVSRIIIEDEQFRTERGVGVGSTVADLRQQHGRICAAVGEGEIVVSAASLPGISFATTLDLSAVRGGARAVEQDPGLVPDTARIERMWVYEGETLCGGS